MSSYFDELKRAMDLLSIDPGVVFLGQSVAYPGTAMRRSLEGVKPNRLLEMPVAEDMQLGLAIGLALDGYLPVCIYPRWNFLLLATNQLVNHLDKMPLYSDYRPRVIIRTAVATPEPLNPGPQHLGDFTNAYRQMLKTVCVETLEEPSHVMPAYRRAMLRDVSTILVEDTAKYA